MADNANSPTNGQGYISAPMKQYVPKKKSKVQTILEYAAGPSSKSGLPLGGGSVWEPGGSGPGGGAASAKRAAKMDAYNSKINPKAVKGLFQGAYAAMKQIRGDRQTSEVHKIYRAAIDAYQFKNTKPKKYKGPIPRYYDDSTDTGI